MLNKPSLRQMMEKVDSKYTLVIVAAKRARAVVDKNPDVLITNAINPVSMALDEIANDRLHWKTRDTGADVQNEYPQS